jgi:beta-glucosidase
LIYIFSAYLNLPSLDFELEVDGKRGWTGTFYSHENDNSNTALQKPFAIQHIDETRLMLSIDHPKGLTHRWSLTLEGNLKPREKNCTFEFGLTVGGRAKVGSSSVRYNCPTEISGV